MFQAASQASPPVPPATVLAHLTRRDPQVVREATVLTVLYRLCLDMSRGQEGRGDTFAAKAQTFKQELDDLLARTVVHWLPAPGGGGHAPPTSRFGTRLSR